MNSFSHIHFAFLIVALTASIVPSPASALDSAPNNSPFKVKFDDGAIVSMQSADDSFHTEFVMENRRLGDAFIRYRKKSGEWKSADSSALKDSGVYSIADDGEKCSATYQITNGDSGALELNIGFSVTKRGVIWTLKLENKTGEPVEIGDLAVSLPMNSSSRRGSSWVLKHSFISGDGSFLFWMRPDSARPYLVMMPLAGTHLEYWDARNRNYRVFIHSAVAGEEAKTHGTNWRQPNTSVTLAPNGTRGDACSYGFQFHWANDYDGVRQTLFDDGGIDVQVVPGMTVPSDLTAQFALRTKQKIDSIEAEFPKATEIKSLGTNGDYRLFQVKFSRLGENRLEVYYGDRRSMFLEFFSTEPIETLIKKRGAFLARSQHRDPAKWYNGLITDWNMEEKKLISPDDYAPIPKSRVYAVTCDDPGLGKPAFLAAKNAEYPVQSEIDALDYYIKNFVWGGLQRTTNETYSYGIYGIPNWKVNRDSDDPGRKGKLHIWRIYDYPHVIVLYFNMYRAAKNNPQIKTALTAKEYLQRAFGTAQAMFTVPHEVWNGWSPYGTGFYNEVVIVKLIHELEANGMNSEAATLRNFWERKVKSFVNGRQDLFRSEYAFDSTGFESTHALAKYAMLHADKPSETNSGIPLANAERFMRAQMAGNLFCRGVIEPAYYYLGSDYRGGAGNSYTLTYMSQMGGWSVLDYALNFATNRAPYLRLGYQSFLSAWALMNTGTPESNYGYWYPGKENDGGAGGGFEPAPYGRTWLGQPHHRGSWYFASEIDLGYCGALRTAATILADDPIFGRFCFGGDFRETSKEIEATPKDGLRRRFFAELNNGKFSLLLDNDRFAASHPISFAKDFSEIHFIVETDNPTKHFAKVRIAGLPPGDYMLRQENSSPTKFSIRQMTGTEINLPIEAGAGWTAFVIKKI